MGRVTEMAEGYEVTETSPTGVSTTFTFQGNVLTVKRSQDLEPIIEHVKAMRERLAGLLGVALDQVSVKATTTEGMGYTGREEGILAQAIASVETPV